jgi:trimeric autotransporter adhesin
MKALFLKRQNIFTNLSTLLVTTLAWVALTANIHSAVLYTNPITDANPSATNPYTTGGTLLTGVTSTGIGRGTGLTASSAQDRYSATAWTTSASVDVNDYFAISLTPGSGLKLNFTNFIYTSQRSSNGPNSFVFRSSLDSFTANIGTPTSTGTTIDLSGALFQDIATTIEFRLYGFSAVTTAGTFSVNDFTFNGAVVPEPSTWVGGGLILGLAMLSQRKRFGQLRFS